MTSPRFDLLFENSPISLQLFAPDGRTIKVNSAWKKLWNLQDEYVENFILKEYNVFSDPVLTHKGTIEYFHRAWKGERVELPTFTYDPAFNGKVGRKRITRPLLCPVQDGEGNLIEVLLINEDITEQQEEFETKDFLAGVAAILLESIDYQKTLDHLASAAIPYFTDGCIIDLIKDGEIHRVVTKHLDPAIAEIMKQLGTRIPLQNSNHVSTRVIQKGKPLLIKKVESEVIKTNAFNDEHARLVALTGLKSGLSVPLSIRGEVIGAIHFWSNSDRKNFDDGDIKIAQEISRYAALAIDNAHLYREAQQAISQREDFISIASHELKTPVTALMLQMEIIQSVLRDQGPLDSVTLNKISAGASRQLDRLSRLIDDMLDLTRVYRRKLVPELTMSADFKQIILQSISRFSEQLESSRIQLTSDLSEGCIVQCDPYRIEQVVTNLITNALNYGLKRPIEIGLYRTNKKAVCWVRDCGVGIAKKDHERIFQRYERVQSATDGRGLGLGLFISRQIVDEHHGKIYVVSELGKGSTFFIELPMP